MRLLQGTKTVEAPPSWAERLRADGRRRVVDVGSGDGRFVYERARRDPQSLYVAVEPDAAALAEYSFRASRKPPRGGVDNAFFVVASVEQLPPELSGIAGLVCVNFPWGGLLRGLLEPSEDMLRALASLAQPGGAFELVLAYDPEHDPNAFAGEPLPPLDEVYIDDVLRPAYAASGLEIVDQRRLTHIEALAIPSTWGRRLLYARPRPVFLVSGVFR